MLLFKFHVLNILQTKTKINDRIKYGRFKEKAFDIENKFLKLQTDFTGGNHFW